MLFAAGFFGVTCACGDVVINEIFYNAPDDLRLEFIELYHSGDEVKDISSWSLADKKGKLVTFPDGTMLEGNAFAVVCRSPELFEEFYEFKPLGVMDHGLGNGGEEVILNDADGNLVEKVAYDDQALWPVVADRISALLDRLHPTAPSALS